MRRIFLLLGVLSLYCGNLFSQDLYTPRNVTRAFKNGTRSWDGNPGKNYWQNHGKYKINISAMPPDRTIRGTESIVYFNNSPDTLRSPVIKLFMNIHKPGITRLQGATEAYLTSGIHIEACTANGKELKWQEGANLYTWKQINLPKSLLPHDSIELTFKWNFDISLISGREGMIDSCTWFLAYFYPRVAVYDDYNGWDKMDFTEDHEFYSDFNDYDVTIHTPKDYIVWGTGTLQRPETLLQPAVLDRFRQSLQSDQIIRIVTKPDLEAKSVTTQNAVNSWQFTARNIPDMAFCLSNHYNWDGGSVVVDDATGRRASAQAAYDDKAKDYYHVAKFARHSLDWLSHNWPGIPYPYEKTTVVQGFAGMEYPMMANDETYPDTLLSRFVAEHEIAHTYMPFYMGINETRYGSMDEGWATTFEFLIGTADMGKDKAERFFKQFRVQRWITDGSPDQDIPIITPGDALKGSGFGNNEYGKAALGYLAMKDLLGDDLFKKCLHEYMRRWNGKHPIPWDFFNTFNSASGKNLNWFWNSWFFSTGYIDFALQDLKKTPTGYNVSIKNTGGFFAPADLIINYSDGTKETKHLSPAIWEKNPKQAPVSINTKKKIDSVKLDGGIFMDADESNNQLTAGEKKGF